MDKPTEIKVLMMVGIFNDAEYCRKGKKVCKFLETHHPVDGISSAWCCLFFDEEGEPEEIFDKEPDMCKWLKCEQCQLAVAVATKQRIKDENYLEICNCRI